MEYNYDPLDLWRFVLLTRINRRFYKDKLPFRDKTVLNVGAGYGRESSLILSQDPKFLILLDNNFNYLESARKNLDKFCHKYLLCADGHNLPFKDGCVDIVAVTDTLHHVVGPYKCMEELIRIARHYIFIDEAKSGACRDFLEYLFFKIGAKKRRVEVCDGKVCDFRINLELLDRLKLKHNLDFVLYPYFIYYFEFYKKTRCRFIRELYKLFLVVLNMAFHLWGNRVIIILKRNL